MSSGRVILQYLEIPFQICLKEGWVFLSLVSAQMPKLTEWTKGETANLPWSCSSTWFTYRSSAFIFMAESRPQGTLARQHGFSSAENEICSPGTCIPSNSPCIMWRMQETGKNGLVAVVQLQPQFSYQNAQCWQGQGQEMLVRMG